MERVIQVENLTKRFGGLTAVDDVSFEVNEGEIFGILGPNGAGKTTTLEIVEGLQRASQGSVKVLGLDTRSSLNEIKEQIGVQLQASAYFDHLSLREILDLFGSFYKSNVSSMDLLKLVDLEEKANVVLKKLSGGQKQRFTVAASLVNNPRLIILDEPTTGLDPGARHSLWDLIRSIHAQGKTIVLTTHYMEEAETLCHRVGIMHQGKLMALDTIPNLVHSLEASYRVMFTTSKPLDIPEDMMSVCGREEKGGHRRLEFRAENPAESLEILLGLAREQKAGIEHIEVVPATLEDVFLDMTGQRIID